MLNENDYSISYSAPTVRRFICLRSKVGWGELADEQASRSLQHSLFHVTLQKNETVIAMGRVVGDGYMYFYIQDVIVDPDFQNLGLGKVIMLHIERYLSKVAKAGATIGLLAAKGKEPFYQQFEYIPRDGESLGLGMCRFI